MPNGLLGLEIASTQVRYAYLEKKLRKIALLKSGTFIVANPDQLKDPGFLTRLIADILSKNRISPSKIFLALSGDHVVINQLNLPRAKKEELEEFLRDEIKRMPQFADAAFDYVYGTSKITEQKLSIVVCALSRQTVDTLIQITRKTGGPLESLEVSPLNLLEFLYTDASNQAGQALLVLEELSSSLSIFWQRDIRFFFRIPTGKKDLTTPQGLLDVTKFQAWSQEIKRLLRSYQRQFLARSVEKLWILGNPSGNNDFLKPLADVLEVQVTSVSPKELGIHVAGPETLEDPLCLLSAAAPAIWCKGIRQKFNFEHFLKRVNVKNLIHRTTVFVIIYAVVLALAGGWLFIRYSLEARNIRQSGRATRQRLAQLKKETAILKIEREAYSQTKTRLIKQASIIKTLNRVSWSQILAKISAAIPKNISLSSFNISGNREVQIEGATFEIDKIAEMIRSLNEAPFLENIKFNYFRETQMNKKRVVEFSITAQLKGQSDEK